MDKLTLLVDGVDVERLPIWAHFNAGKNGVRDTDGAYRFSAKVGEVFVQFRAGQDEYRSPSDLRIEFNPNKLENRDVDTLTGLLRRGKDSRVSRVDIALDFIGGPNLGDMGWHLNGTRKQVRYMDGGDIETVYLGSPRARRRFRIYNKALEQGERFAWWRIEAQHRPSGHDPLPVGLFDGLRPLAVPAELDPVGDWDEYAICRAMIADPVVVYLCPVNRRKRWLDRLESAGRSVVRPGEVYRKHREPLHSVLAHWQGLTRNTLELVAQR